jgi:hypothetical protein
MAGFEPAASTSQMWRDTGLRYIPFGFAKVRIINTLANIFLRTLTVISAKLLELNYAVDLVG